MFCWGWAGNAGISPSPSLRGCLHPDVLVAVRPRRGGGAVVDAPQGMHWCWSLGMEVCTLPPHADPYNSGNSFLYSRTTSPTLGYAPLGSHPL